MLRALVLVAVLVLAAPTARVAQASEISVSAARAGEAVEITATALMRADAAGAWRVLTAYDRYASFIPDLLSSRVVSRDGDRSIVEHRGNARFLWMNEPMSVRLEVTETPPSVIESRLVAGTVRDLRGRYELAPADDGALRLTYFGRIVPDGESAGFFDMMAVRSNVSRQFRALVAEIERVAALTGEPPARR